MELDKDPSDYHGRGSCSRHLITQERDLTRVTRIRNQKRKTFQKCSKEGPILTKVGTRRRDTEPQLLGGGVIKSTGDSFQEGDVDVTESMEECDTDLHTDIEYSYPEIVWVQERQMEVLDVLEESHNEEEDTDSDVADKSRINPGAGTDDATKLTKFKTKMLRLAAEEARRWETSTKIIIDDPQLKYYLNYQPDVDKFSVGEVEVKLNQETQCFECSECGRTFAPGRRELSHAIQWHIWQQHLFELMCPLCPILLESYDGYWKHLEMYHQLSASRYLFHSSSNIKKSCPRISSSHKPKHKLERRNKEASEKKTFKCDTCSKEFASMKNLKKHLPVHSEERPYPCRKGCGYAFKDTKHIARHEMFCNGTMTKAVLSKWKKYNQHNVKD